LRREHAGHRIAGRHRSPDTPSPTAIGHARAHEYGRAIACPVADADAGTVTNPNTDA